MKKRQTLDLFEKAYEKGLRGEVSSLQVWLKEQQVEPQLIESISLTKTIAQSPELLVDREEALQSVAEFIGYFEKEREGTFHIPVVGVQQSGKSVLLNALFSSLERIESKLKRRLTDAREFGEINEGDDESHRFYVFLDEIRKEKPDLLLVDSFEKDKDPVNSLKQIVEAGGHGVIITAWTPESWGMLRDSVSDVMPVAKEVYLDPLSRDAVSEIVDLFATLVSKERFKVPEEVSDAIYKLSSGIPGVAVQLFTQGLKEAFFKHKKMVDAESIESAAGRLGIKDIQQRLSQLSEFQILVLKHLLLEHDERGTRPSTLTEQFGKDKATISYHLSSLISMKVLTVDRIGRSAFYRVKPEVIPFVEMKIAQESEFLA
jgi:DNA-binding transcriptional ArsR family regulator